eukprot:930903-Pelagomonas_calceolata.AAC.2
MAGFLYLITHWVYIVPPSRLKLLPRPCTPAMLNFNQVDVPLVCTQLVRLSYVSNCAGSVWGPAPAA